MLADSPAAKKWGWATLIRALYDARPALVLNGGAVGPDAWATGLAKIVGVPARELLPNGDVRAQGELDEALDLPSRWAPEGVSPGPLPRNEELVRTAAAYARGGATVLVVALYAPWSKTQGTRHTVKLASAAGLECDVHVCPAAFARWGA